MDNWKGECGRTRDPHAARGCAKREGYACYLVGMGMSELKMSH